MTIMGRVDGGSQKDVIDSCFAMARVVRVNNFIQHGDKAPDIDWLSKIFIGLEWLLGLNRISALTTNAYINILSFFYAFICVTAMIIITHAPIQILQETDLVENLKFVQYVICATLGFATRKRIRCYYEKLNKFDLEVGCKPKVTRESFCIFLTMIALSVVIIVMFFKPYLLPLIPLHLIYVIENHYFGLLFNLLNQRLCFINHCLESSLTTLPPLKTSTLVAFQNDGKQFHFSMNKLMDFYYIIISAYDQLVDSIKWQLLFTTITSFLYTLFIAYHIVGNLIRENGHESLENMICDLVLLASEILPLMTPCLTCDWVRCEVRKLRELLASKLFQSKLDKSNRSVARALLALTKARDLSFALLRMVDISISLPFSYIGLLATYLIIMLQFEKVINPAGFNISVTNAL